MSSPAEASKPGLHPRNPHRARYDFPALVRATPALGPHVRRSPAGTPTIDFSDPAAVQLLNQALLRTHYGIEGWNVPPGYLCPPIPGRADYLHHLADLLADAGGEPPRGAATRILDLGVGANCVYPLIGVASYGWTFVGTEVDPAALAHARTLLGANPAVGARVELRLQRDRGAIFAGVIAAGERFAACLCNPPFHASAAEAAASTDRKLRQLHGGSTGPRVRNFGGRSHELWCAGGEAAFIGRMIRESAARPELCGWFTTLVASRDSLPPLEQALRRARAAEVRVIPMAQGQKQSRILAWRFAGPPAR